MSDTQATCGGRTPLHLWIVGVLALLWGSMGLMDFFMTQTRNEAYLANFTPEQLEFFTGFPQWLVVFWGVAVVGGALGPLLLLLRKALAVPVLAASLLCMIGVSIHNFGFSNGMEIMGGLGPLLFTIAIFAVSFALYFYARALARRGVLR